MVLPPDTRHFRVLCGAGQKLQALRRCIATMGAQRALVFVRSQSAALYVRERLASKMEVRGWAGKGRPRGMHKEAQRDRLFPLSPKRGGW